MSNLKIIDILLVDDNDDDVFMIEQVFEDAKLITIIHHVENGEEALNYLRMEGDFKDAKTPGLIFLDISMPIKGGFDVLKELKEDENLRHIPVIMLTSSKRDEDILTSYGLGASSYIRKPMDFSDFSKIMKNFEIYWSLVSKIPKK
jgi:CheY-like chemotaxis protein